MVTNESFAAAVRFAHRRYLAGQAVLSETIRARAWQTRDIPFHIADGDLTPTLVRILRGCPGSAITHDNILDICLDIKKDLRSTTTTVCQEAEHRLTNLWRMLEDLGVGRLVDVKGQVYCQKHPGPALSQLTLTWLQDNRIPAYMFGIWSRAASQIPSSDTGRPQLQHTNPSTTVRAADTAAAVQGGVATPSGSIPATAALVPVPSPDAPSGPSQVPTTAAAPVDTPAQHAVTPAVIAPASANSTIVRKPPVILCSQVLPGLVKTKPQARAAVRQSLADRNLSALVTDSKVTTHARYFRFRGVCLQCLPNTEAVRYEATYYRQTHGAIVGTLTISSTGSHTHDENARSDSGRVFLPLHVNIAREYMQQPGTKNRKGLKAAFHSHNVAASALPTDSQLSQWLKNHRRSASAVDSPAGPPRQMEMERSLEEWPTEMPEDLEELYLVTDPPYKCDKHSVCVAFSSRGMIHAMKRLAGPCGVLFMDAKQGCTQDNWGVITGALSVKDGLRNTSFAKVEGRKVQGTAYTSHAQPGLQALIEVEKTENIVQFLMTLQSLWAKHCPDKPPLETWVKEVHTDFHPALEAARKILMGGARPCKDFFHLMQKQPGPSLHLVVMQRVLRSTFDDAKASMAARMLCTHGQDLHKLLHSAGILGDMKGVDGTTVPSCAQMSLVKEFFVDFVFVVVREDGHPPAPFFPGPRTHVYLLAATQAVDMWNT